MILKNKRVVFFVALNCVYGGNVISSLNALAEHLMSVFGVSVFWVFPEQEKADWLRDLMNNYTVFFTKEKYRKTEGEIYDILNIIKPDLIHSHYESYDIPIAKAVRRLGGNIKLVFHIHVNMNLKCKKDILFPLRKIHKSLRYYHHYGVVSREATLIAVSPEAAYNAAYFRKLRFRLPVIRVSNPKLYEMDFSSVGIYTLINGICEDRINNNNEKIIGNPFSFLSFGGRFYGKGIDVILKAAKILEMDGRDFLLYVTEGEGVKEGVQQFFGSRKPKWLKVIPQSENISNIFNSADCYISASRAETMSTAIAEATLYQKPVIQSDIVGTYWNAQNPSSFLFQDGDSYSLYLRMKEVMDFDREALAQRAEQTYFKNKEMLSIDTWINRVISIYKLA